MPEASRIAQVEHWKRVGAFVRQRRVELNLSQPALMRVLEYRSPNAVSNVERGLRGIVIKRGYAWADALEVPPDAFLRFVMGDVNSMPPIDPVNAAPPTFCGVHWRLTPTEQLLLVNYRKLPADGRRKLRKLADELARVHGRR